MFQMLDTPLGPMVAKWTRTGLYSFSFASEQSVGEFLAPQIDTPHSSLIRELSEAIEKYFEGGSINYPLERLDWTATTAFHQALLRACYAIPPGQTKTYRELAVECGSSKAARAAGQAMAKNRWPIIIPCHRVVGSSGNLTGYSGTGGLHTKHLLLRHEAGESLASQLAQHQ